MPRNYVWKKQPRVGGTYDATQVKNTLAKISSNRKSMLQASKVFWILHTSLHGHLMKKIEVKKPVIGGGRSQEIVTEIEKDMAQGLQIFDK